MANSADVVVIGGGCQGASIAFQLAKRGAGRVVLIEKREIASGATGKSSAIVRTHYTHEALACMALRARTIFERFAEVVGGESGFRRTGFLVLVGPRDLTALNATVQMHQCIGIRAHVLMLDDLRAQEPRLTAEGVGAAAWEPDSGYADPNSTANAFAAAAKREGAELRIGESVTRIVAGTSGVEAVETDAGRIATRTVVVAAGYRTSELLAPHGVEIPITPVRHTIALVQRTRDFGAIHPIVSDRVLGGYYRPEGNEITHIGATAPYDGHVDGDVEMDKAAPPDDIRKHVEWFARRFPSQADASLVGHYTGTYDCSPDLQPMLGPVSSIPGLHVAVGFSGHGFKLSPVIGELIAEKILTGRTTLVELDLFSPNRFAEKRPIVSPHAYSTETLS